MADDAELLGHVRSKVADEYGLSESQGRQLRGATVRELFADAKAMRDELGHETAEVGERRHSPDLQAALGRQGCRRHRACVRGGGSPRW